MTRLLAAAAALALTGRLVRPGALRLEGRQTDRMHLRHAADVQNFYPPDARKAGIDGAVVVDLLINDDGYVVEAQVISESPPGKGFGLAALDVAKTFEYENPFRRLVLMAVTVSFLP